MGVPRHLRASSSVSPGSRRELCFKMPCRLGPCKGAVVGLVAFCEQSRPKPKRRALKVGKGKGP